MYVRICTPTLQLTHHFQSEDLKQYPVYSGRTFYWTYSTPVLRVIHASDSSSFHGGWRWLSISVLGFGRIYRCFCCALRQPLWQNAGRSTRAANHLSERLKGLPAYPSQMTRTAFTFNSYGQSPFGIPFEEHRFASWNPRWCVTLLLDRIVFQTCLEKPICGGQFPEFPSCQNSPKALPSLLNSRFFEVGQCQSWEIRWSMMKRGYFFFPIKLLPQLFSPMLDQAVNLET